MAEPFARAGAVPGIPAEEEAAANPVAPVQPYLRTSSEIVAALHASDIDFLEET